MAYAFVLPNAGIAPTSRAGVGFALSLVGTAATFAAGVRIVRREQARAATSDTGTPPTKAVLR